MQENNKNIFYLIVAGILSYILYVEFTFKAPYISDFSVLNLISTNSVFSWTWVFLIFSSAILMLPLFFKKIIGLVGATLFILTIVKPFIIQEIPRESASEYVISHQVELKEIINHFEQNGSIGKEAYTNLGFTDFKRVNDTYVFVIHGLIGNGRGICWSREKDLPKSLFGESAFYKKINSKWHEFSYG